MSNRQGPQSSLDRFCAGKLADMEARFLRRTLQETERQPIGKASRNGSPYISFSCNDYLGLSHHPKVIEAAVDAAKKYGVGSGASRLVTGNHPLFRDLEQKLAAIKGTEDCLVFGSGYLANTGLIPALAGSRDLVLVDELAHACINTGAQLTRGTVVRFRNNDVTDLEAHLCRQREKAEKCLIVTDGVFSMDGTLAPLPELRAVADRHDAWLITDDAHGIGTIGGGRGSAFAFDPPSKADIQMGTLSKAVGGYGGYVCATRTVCEFLRNRARSFVFSTGLSPMAVAAASAALDIIMTDRDLVERPLNLARMFCRLTGLPEPCSPIVPVIIGENEAALQASERLAAAGYLVTAIRPPTVPVGTARLRVAFSASHLERDVEMLARLVHRELKGSCA